MDINDVPKIHTVTYNYLKDTYNLEYLLSITKEQEPAVRIGYMKAVSDILNHIKLLTNGGDEDVF